VKQLPSWSSLSLDEKRILDECWCVGDVCGRRSGPAIDHLRELQLIRFDPSGHWVLTETGKLYMRSAA